MWKFAATALICGLAASSAYAADAKVDTAVKTFDQVAASPDKLKAYCALAKKMEEVGEDDKKAEAASAEIDGYFTTLGDDFDSAWSLGEDTKEGSPESKQLEDSLQKLDAKCT